MKRLLFASLVLTSLWCLGASAAQGQWQSLFDGKTMNGWQPSERPESWAIKDGTIITQGDRSHLFYTGPVANHEFRNFEFMAEVMTLPGSNSGVFIHTKSPGPGLPPTGYELQVINSNPKTPPGAYVEHKMTGSIYAVRNTWRTTVRDHEWFEYRIKVSGKTIQTFINGMLICEYTEPPDPWRSNDRKTRVLGSGTFALQAHDPGSVARFRNLRVRLLPDNAPSLGTPIADRELDELITRMSNDNYALIDLGIVAPAGSAGEPIAQSARFFGMTLGPWPPDALARATRHVVIVNDRDNPPDPTFLQSVKAAGSTIAFSSGGAATIDEARLKRRLQAIVTAKLSSQDLWIPGKN